MSLRTVRATTRSAAWCGAASDGLESAIRLGLAAIAATLIAECQYFRGKTILARALLVGSVF